MSHTSKSIPVAQLLPNTGQIEGLPKNPRFIRDAQFAKLVQSIQSDPEMMHLRECIVFPLGKKFVIIAGNMRHRACLDLQYKEIPCKILPKDTSVQKLAAIAVKDNVSFGEWNTEDLANEWNQTSLSDWGVGVAGWHQQQSENPDDDGEPGSLGRSGPRASDDEYAVYEQVMLHENKKELLEALNQVKEHQGLDKLEDALMFLVRNYTGKPAEV